MVMFVRVVGEVDDAEKTWVCGDVRAWSWFLLRLMRRKSLKDREDF